VTRPATALDVAVEFAGALPVPLGHARPIIPAPPIDAVDVLSARLEQRIRDLAAQQRKHRAEESAARLRGFLAAAQSNTTPEEGAP
jgi:hypothetical protein